MIINYINLTINKATVIFVLEFKWYLSNLQVLKNYFI